MLNTTPDNTKNIFIAIKLGMCEVCQELKCKTVSISQSQPFLTRCSQGRGGYDSDARR